MAPNKYSPCHDNPSSNLHPDKRHDAVMSLKKNTCSLLIPAILGSTLGCAMQQAWAQPNALPPPNQLIQQNETQSLLNTPATTLMFEEAQSLLQSGSPQLQASKQILESKTLEEQALKLFGGPIVTVSGNTGYYDFSGDTTVGQMMDDTSIDINNPLGGMGDIDNKLRNVGVGARVHGHYQFANANVLWPIYTGGKVSAVKNLAKGRSHEAQADNRNQQAEVQAQLVTRYFGSQLAQSAAQLRQDAVTAITVHDKTAQRMLDEGMIAKVERLQAKVALENAKRDYEKANSDAILANVALQRLLQSNRRIAPTTALFLNQKPLPSLDYFLDLAMKNHPGLEKVSAKKEQAEAMHQVSESRFKPDITLFAQHQIKSNNPNRMAGVNLRWTLWSSVDRRLMNRASLATINAANLMDQQAKEDISILVEKNWRDVENARLAYLSMNSSIKAAEEYLRLRQASLKEGLGTVSEAIDAQVNLTKAKTEQLQTANSYVQALSALLNSAGIPEQFSLYLKQADTKVKP